MMHTVLTRNYLLFLTSFLTFTAVFLLLLPALGLLPRTLTLRNVFAAGLWRLLLTRGCPLPWLLALILDCRSLLRRSLRWG